MHSWGVTLEADPRLLETAVEKLGLAGAKGVGCPGVVRLRLDLEEVRRGGRRRDRLLDRRASRLGCRAPGDPPFDLALIVKVEVTHACRRIRKEC